jgi:hypothetical protein
MVIEIFDCENPYYVKWTDSGDEALVMRVE